MSGIAAILLDGGRTVHGRFRLPVPLPPEGAVANITANSGTAHLLRHTDLIIWDEAPNAPKAAFDAVDRCLRDILEGVPGRSSKRPFGGMTMLLGGDLVKSHLSCHALTPKRCALSAYGTVISGDSLHTCESMS